MAPKFHGTLKEFQDKLLSLGLDGDWEDLANGVHKFKNRDKAGVLWSETKGTVWFDGPAQPKDALAEKVGAILADGAIATPAASGNTIFVVHGREALGQVTHKLRSGVAVAAPDHP